MLQCPGTTRRCLQGLQKGRELASESSRVHASSGHRIGTFFVINIMPKLSCYLLTVYQALFLSALQPSSHLIPEGSVDGHSPLSPHSQRPSGTQLQLNKVGIIGSWIQGGYTVQRTVGGWGGGGLECWKELTTGSGLVLGD